MNTRILLSIFFINFILVGCTYEDNTKRSMITLEAKSDSIKLGNNYAEYRIDNGAGIPCIVVGLAHMYPGTFSEKLKSKFQFIHADYRGIIKKNEAIDVNSITIDSIVNDIDLLRRTLGLKKIAVFGHSVHGLAALEYGRIYPENTSHIIVVGTWGVRNSNTQQITDEYWETMATDERKSRLSSRRSNMKDSISNSPSSKQLALTYITDAPIYWFDPNYNCSWIWKEVKPLNMAYVENLYGNIFKEYDLIDSDDKITAPIFVAHGKYDFAVPPTTWDNIEMENIQIEILEESSHWPFVEEQELFDEKLIRWLGSLNE